MALAALIATTMLTSCHKEKSESPKVAVTVTIDNIDGSHSQGKSQTIDQALDINSVTLLFFNHSDHSLVSQIDQRRTDASINFGTFDLMLEVGIYDMVVLGYSFDSLPNIQSYTVASLRHFGQIFHAAQTVTVTQSGTSTLSATLQRVSSCLTINATDEVPADAVYVKFSFSGSGATLNPSTGLAATNTGFDLLFLAGSNLTVHLPLYENNQVMNVTVTVQDASLNDIISHTFVNLGFVCNRRTILSGPLYHQGGTSGFTVDTDWLDDADTINFK